MSLISQLSSLLLVSNRPLSSRKLAELTGEKQATVQAVLEELAKYYENQDLGIRLFQTGNEFQLVSDPGNREVVESFVKQEVTGELTRPQLETLSIIAYRGPIAKSEIELIRGINCTLILRNLQMRGLVREHESSGQIAYSVSMDFLKFLGIGKTSDLPEYGVYSKHELIAELLNSKLVGSEVVSSDASVGVPTAQARRDS